MTNIKAKDSTDPQKRYALSAGPRLKVSLWVSLGAAIFIVIYDYIEAIYLHALPEQNIYLSVLNGLFGGLIVAVSAYLILTIYSRKREKDIYEESERKFISVSQAAQDGIVMLDSHTNILFWNEAAEGIFGFTEQEVLGKKLRSVIDHKFINKTYPEKTEMLSEPGSGMKVLEMTAKKKDGTEFPIELSMSGVKTGGQWNTVGIVRDITERKKAEAELKTAYSRIREARSQLAKLGTMDMVSKMASGVAHDVKNPLTVILLGAEYLSEAFQVQDPSIAETLNRMTDAVRQADSVIKGLLDVASLSRLDLAPCDLSSLIDEALLSIELEYSKQKVAVKKDFAPDLPMTNLDQAKMKRVFENLFTNSLHAMPQGGALSIRASLGKAPISKTKETVVIIEVSDTGCGIPDDILGKVFEPFFTTRSDSGGTGLGLSTVKSIIEMHQGEISIRNRNAGGLSVIISLNRP